MKGRHRVSERDAQIWVARANGARYSEIGRHFGITGSWARDVCRTVQRKIENQWHFFSGCATDARAEVMGRTSMSTTASLFPADAGATFGGPGDIYRYHLWRRWSLAPRTCVFVMLNPSTATDVIDDPTIRRCRGFAQREGCGRLEVVNIFALRSTAPELLYSTKKPEGDPENLEWILETAEKADLVVCAWGTHGEYRGRGSFIRRALDECAIKSFSLGLTTKGHPKHPLYLRADAALEVFT